MEAAQRACGTAGMNVEIIAHRGASFDAPENTLASVNLAWVQGADAVEVDVQCSKDGRLVVIHDATTRKTAGVRKRICDQTLAELRALDVGSWKGRQWAGEPIPLLDDVLASIPDGKRLFVEIKGGADCVGELAEIMRRCGKKSRQVALIGFSLPTMKLAKEALPALEVSWVAEFRRNLGGHWTPDIESLISRARSARIDGLDLGARGPWTPALGRKVHAAGLRLYVWTVDSAAKARQVIAAGADGITTNKPAWLRARLAAEPRGQF